ncbi:ribosome biogenesis GTPase Der [Rhodoblastus acidophilus]|uniref:GTPase Der n=1 Tax=Candidatus Rhodoblastus alkanivorans TaxID=2954117 RepID=A0ABS9Z7D1_9HYPH|nr:ribosome biogenesis GTPase Der [Candidatus Rhodoblastus alkanivorans]MCI4678317.1 ribosome biogenesis GTPase Der [Candidatus Rhodoblastus alkanivorans]MCI4683575.1 ribosome biogenesis GTPase Der [Candidatus Rhodoblastus alkanivorans]MDI4640890.1 ribosome biogenesis GTPase Der [Rhodoblastus acidophilus]
MPFTVAIIGRPNVGKSTLFNRLVGKKLALVDDQPGVTRDRRAGEARLGDLSFTIIDTAGLEEGGVQTLSGRMRAQTEAAIQDADAIFFMIDARVGVTPEDSHFASLVRRAGKPLILLANKAEGKTGEAGAYDAFTLGLGDPVPLSAEHGDGFAELYAALLEALPEATALSEDEEDARPELALADDEDGSELDPTKPLRIAIVGRPNAGKSTLINRLLGEERLLTGPEAGVTRDSIGVEHFWRKGERDDSRKRSADAGASDTRALKVFDTAGLRKRAKVDGKLEKLAAADALRAVKFAEVVVVLLDAAIPFEKQDLTITDLVAREGRALVIGLNKWDMIADKGAKLVELREEADRLLPQVRGAAVVPVSGATGQGVDALIEAAIKAHEIWNKRISTARLNRWLEGALEQNPPPAVAGRRIKIRYMTQPKARPPHFVIFGNQLDELPESYQRYLINGLRKTFDLPGTPIRVTLKQGDNPYAGQKRRR